MWYQKLRSVSIDDNAYIGKYVNTFHTRTSENAKQMRNLGGGILTTNYPIIDIDIDNQLSHTRLLRQLILVQAVKTCTYHRVLQYVVIIVRKLN